MDTRYLMILASYLLGAIPTGLLIGKCFNIDVRESGSGNIGATNVSRLLGKKLGALTLIADATKALVPMLIASWIYGETGSAGILVSVCGAAAFLGHLYPVYLKFSGGKGVATALGIFLYLAPLVVVVVAVIFVAVVAVSGFVSLGSLTAAAAIPVLIWLFEGPREHVLLALFVAVLVWIKHHENIGRLCRGEEKSWKRSSAGAEKK